MNRSSPLLVLAAVVAIMSSGCSSSGTPRAANVSTSPGTAPASAAAASSAPATAAAKKPLAGTTIGVDPGHNGKNYTDPSFINHQIWNGREYENCNTTGTSTNGGYPEARFTWHVARYLVTDLHAAGAKVVETRHNNHGVGPCVNRRAQIINRAHANVGIDIHGDGGPPGGRGFTVLEPVKDRYNKHVIHSSASFGHILRHHILAGTAMPTSSYDGVNGITHRNDLAGLNLTKVPLVLIECGNMRNATDARLMTSSRFQKRLARTFTAAIVTFVRRHH